MTAPNRLLLGAILGSAIALGPAIFAQGRAVLGPPSALEDALKAALRDGHFKTLGNNEGFRLDKVVRPETTPNPTAMGRGGRGVSGGEDVRRVVDFQVGSIDSQPAFVRLELGPEFDKDATGNLVVKNVEALAGTRIQTQQCRGNWVCVKTDSKGKCIQYACSK